jgi:Sec-independent protein translocase protein TatA
MKLASANKVDSTKKPPMREQAQVRMVILALVSFLLGVAATALWFYLASNRTAESLSSQVNGPENQQDNQQPAVPPSGANSPARAFVEQPVPVAPAAIEDVKRALPNYASVSLDEGTEILREATLKKYAAAVQELQSQVARAQAELSQAENKSPAEQQAALRHLQQVQVEQNQKLQQIGGQLQTQIAALKQLKGTTP